MQQSIIINGYKAYLMSILKQVANCKRDKKMPVEYGILIEYYNSILHIYFYTFFN